MVLGLGRRHVHLENANDPTSPNNSAPLEISSSTNIVAPRLLVAHNNQDVNSSALSVYNSSDVLVEECEAYDFSLGGIAVANGSVRRSYASTRLLRNVALGDGFGFLSSLFDSTTNHNIGTHLVDHVSIDAVNDGFYFRSNMQASCTRCTAIGSAMSGWLADTLTNHTDAASSSCSNCLVVDNSDTGFHVEVQAAGWSITSSNAFGNATDFTPTGVSELVRPSGIDPQLDGCLVYLPAGSPMRGTAFGDIGAEVEYRYVDGALTTVPLWHPITGAFSCGAVVAGVNDDPATSCSGVHERLHVGTSGCALPYPAP